ncbi:MAG: hypothetical protein ABJ308_03155 [Halieaceae bacterium]
MAWHRKLVLILAPLLLVACKHPLEIEGQGDIIELERGLRGCSLEEFEADFARCSDNPVVDTETALYSALPRAGWRFSHWNGACARDSPAPDCRLDYLEAFAELWDEQYPDTPLPPLKAVFVEDAQANPGTRYITSSFGTVGLLAYGSLLDALVSDDGGLRYTSQQASTREYFDRSQFYYQRQGDGLLATGATSSSLVSGGGATVGLDFMTLVDTDSSDNEISVAYLMPELEEAAAGLFFGSYYCGHISTRQLGFSTFFRAVMTGNGTGAVELISDRYSRSGSTGATYQVFADGTATLDYDGRRLTGSLSADGSVFAGAEINDSGKGAAICLRSSSNRTLFDVIGSYYGAWMSAQPVSAVTDLLVSNTGQTAESVLRDSIGGRSYFLAADFLLAFGDGRLETSTNFGASSPDGRLMFIINTDPNKYPTLIVYVRKT